MPDIKRKYEIVDAEGDYEVASEVRDIGDKQVAPPSFVRGVSHVGVQVFLSKNIVDNPTISISYELFVEPVKKVASISSIGEVSVT